MTEETWAPIPGYKGDYEVSDLGRVRRLTYRGRNAYKVAKTPKILAQSLVYGYLRVGLHKDNQPSHCLVHRLVLLAFRGEPDDGMEAAHLNGCRTDNRLANLAWTTRRENHAHKHLHGTAQVLERANSVKLTSKEVLQIRERIARGVRLVTIAREFSVNASTISSIKRGRTWRTLRS